MKRGLRVLPIVLILAVPLGASRALRAQTAGVHVPEIAEDKVLRVTVHPMDEPRAALKYQLLPGFLDRTPGNAAVHYGKVTAEQTQFFGDRELQEKMFKWANMPLDELPRDEIRRTVRSESILGSLRRASRCRYCDWQLPLHEGDLFAMLIPEAQETRSFARLLAVRARLEIAEGKYDEALQTLQMGYALARHVAEGETLIHGLIGIAISGSMSGQVLTLIQQPDAPNLYWALTSLPRPVVSVERGIEAEMHAVHLSFPDLRDLEDTTRSPEYWRQSFLRFGKKLVMFDGGPDLGRPEILTALAVRCYPMAKRALVDRGRSPEEVEAMPVPQVVLLYTRQTYEELRDDIFKWFHVPYWEAQAGMDEAEDRLKQAELEQREILPLATLLLPAVRTISSAVARTNREVAVLRTIEALRMYAATHDGRLPGKLSHLAVPVPVDPLTGKPFAYQLRGDTAVIEGPPMPGLLLRLEIKVTR